MHTTTETQKNFFTFLAYPLNENVHYRANENARLNLNAMVLSHAYYAGSAEIHVHIIYVRCLFCAQTIFEVVPPCAAAEFCLKWIASWKDALI